MKTKAKIKFLFIFNEESNSTMEVTHTGESDVSEEAAIIDAWQKMAKDEFDRNLILKTQRIEVVNIEIK